MNIFSQTDTTIPNSTRGFTLIEMMVVIAIIGILVVITYASFSDARKQSRDRIRQTQLQELRVAIELYKDKYGRYPQVGCGVNPFNTSSAQVHPYFAGPGPFGTPPNDWGRTCDDYIVGLVPEFMERLPRDPMFENLGGRGYMYTTNSTGSSYKVIAHVVAESLLVDGPGHPFARCNSSCSSVGFGTVCQTAIPQDQYAIYSAGAECW